MGFFSNIIPGMSKKSAVLSQNLYGTQRGMAHSKICTVVVIQTNYIS